MQNITYLRMHIISLSAKNDWLNNEVQDVVSVNHI